MREAGLTLRGARPRHYKADPGEEAEFRGTVQKTHLIDERWTFVAVDQSSKYVGTVEPRGWYPVETYPRLPVWNARTKVTTQGAVTHEGESLYLPTEDNLTADHSFRLLKALTDEFGKQLIVILDRAPYFYAKDLWEIVSGERLIRTIGDTSVACVQGDTL